MPENTTLDRSSEVLAPWKVITLSVLFWLSAAHSLWRYGLRGRDWVSPLVLIGLLFFSVQRTGPLGRGLQWPVSIFYLVWLAVFTFWFADSRGWFPGLCLGTIFFLLPGQQQNEPWRENVRKPLGLILILLGFAMLVWFMLRDGGWFPSICIGGLIVLLSLEHPRRRPLVRNLWRPLCVGWIFVMFTCAVWVWTQPALASIFTLISILILWFVNLLLHSSSGERPLALSHPQS